MTCPELEQSEDMLFWRGFTDRVKNRRVPLHGSLALTHRCNFNCVHCYLGVKEDRNVHSGTEIGTSRLLSLIDEITEAGCLYLVLTGGEPLLRSDFAVVYQRAREKGLLVTVFSNGTLVSDDLLRLFRKFPPVEVEITLYGASAETCERITGVADAYETCMRGIRALLENGTRVNLKTVLMTLNRHELNAMRDIARNFGVKFRFDAAITPCLNHNRVPLDFRVTAEEAVEHEMEDPAKVRRWVDFYEKNMGVTLGDYLYGCGAGMTAFHVDASGCLHPCLMTDDIGVDLSGSSFSEGWDDIGRRIRARKAGADFACRACRTLNFCGYCPAAFRLETGREDVPSDFLCRMGELRLQNIQKYMSKGAQHG